MSAVSSSFYFFTLVCASIFLSSCGQFATRPHDIFPTTTVPKSRRVRPDEDDDGRRRRDDKDKVVVRTSLGDIAGRRVLLPKLAWTPGRDPRDRPPGDLVRPDPDPLPAQNDVTIFEFLGIPYAEAPVADRRFKRPEKLKSLPLASRVDSGGRETDGVFEAFDFGPVCYQNTEARPSIQLDRAYHWLVDENCLYLNVFTPKVSTLSRNSYPVVAFLHGGNFQYGSANDWPAHILASKGLVVVTINYRLGPFGFLSLGDDATGNYGILDQRMALEWIREYIYAFGGNHKSVTLVGHDAGAVSAGLHMLSPGSTDLFQAAVAMSGADVSYHQVISKPELATNNTIKIARYVGCSIGTIQDRWACVQGKSSEDLRSGAEQMLVEYNRFSFLPTVDGRVLRGQPEYQLRRVLARDAGWSIPSPVTYLTGLNRHDGIEVLLSDRARFEFQPDFTISEQNLNHEIADFVVKRNYTTNMEAVVEAIKSKYTYWPDRKSSLKVRDKFVEFASDAYYVAPVSLSAHLHSETGSRVYFYVNNYNISAKLEDGSRFVPYWMGVCHECDLYLLFGFPWLPTTLMPEHLKHVKWTREDMNASETFMAMFRRFAQIKDPNLPREPTLWQNFQPRIHWYLNFNYSRRTLERDYRWESVAFWNHYITQLADLFTTTYSPVLLSYRKENLIFKVTTGTLILLLLLVLVLTGTFAYLLFERPKRRREKQQRLVTCDESWTPPRNRSLDLEMMELDDSTAPPAPFGFGVVSANNSGRRLDQRLTKV